MALEGQSVSKYKDNWMIEKNEKSKTTPWVNYLSIMKIAGKSYENKQEVRNNKVPGSEKKLQKKNREKRRRYTFFPLLPPSLSLHLCLFVILFAPHFLLCYLIPPSLLTLLSSFKTWFRDEPQFVGDFLTFSTYKSLIMKMRDFLCLHRSSLWCFLKRRRGRDVRKTSDQSLNALWDFVMNDGDHADDDDDDQKVDADTRLKWSHSMTLKIDWESVMNIINSIVSYFSCPMMMIVHQLHCVPHVHGMSCNWITQREEEDTIFNLNS